MWPQSTRPRTRWAPLLLFVSCIARDSLRDGRAPSAVPSNVYIALAQIAFSLALYLVAKRKPSNALRHSVQDKESASADVRDSTNAAVLAGSMRFNLLAAAAGAFYAIQASTDDANAVNNLTELHVVFPVCTLVLLIYLRLAFGRSVESSAWFSVALQFCGLYMVMATVSARFNHATAPTIASFAIASSLALITSYYTVRRLEGSLPSFAGLALVTFISKLVSTVALACMDGSSSPKPLATALPIRLDFSDVLLFVFECCRGICMFFALDGYDVVFVSVLLTTANIAWLTISALFARFFSFGVFGGCAIALIAASLQLRPAQRSDEMARESFKPRRFFGITAALLIAILMSHIVLHSEPVSYPPSVSQLFRFEAAHPKCYPRKQPASLRLWWQSDYHEFDNVLLIVFFSHARYDANLDLYKEAYSKYFPNVVFIGPGNREDAGFKHSFDVVVNSSLHSGP